MYWSLVFLFVALIAAPFALIPAAAAAGGTAALVSGVFSVLSAMALAGSFASRLR